MTPANNKANAKAFYDLMFNQAKPAEAIERYAGAEYIQHNPEVSWAGRAYGRGQVGPACSSVAVT